MKGSIWLSREDEISDKYLGSEESPGNFHKIFLETAKFLQSEKKIDSIPSEKEIEDFINSSYIKKSLDASDGNI